MIYLKISEVAKRLQVTHNTVKGYIKAGKLEAVKMNTHYRVSEEALQKFLKAAGGKEDNG